MDCSSKIEGPTPRPCMSNMESGRLQLRLIACFMPAATTSFACCFSRGVRALLSPVAILGRHSIGLRTKPSSDPRRVH